MTSEAFKEPANMILMLVAFSLLMVLIVMIFKMNLSQEACKAVADQLNPDVFEKIMDKIGIRPLQWLCETLL